MIIDVKMGFSEDMMLNYTQDEINKMARENLAHKIAQQILQADIIQLQSKFTNNIDASHGVEYGTSLVVMTKKEAESLIRQLKVKR
jgi:hypothetical protein